MAESTDFSILLALFAIRGSHADDAQRLDVEAAQDEVAGEGRRGGTTLAAGQTEAGGRRGRRRVEGRGRGYKVLGERVCK
jgi:hypothetical protein